MPDKEKVKKVEEKKEVKKEKKEIKPVKKEAKKEKKEEKITDSYDYLGIIKFVLMSERAIQIIESQNKLVFIVDKRAKKTDIKKAVEDSFSTKVSRIQTMLDQKSRKKAYVKFKKAGEAGEIAIRLGII